MDSITSRNQIFNLRSEQTESPPAYKVIEVSAIVAGSGSVLAYFSLKIGGIVIHNVSLRQGRKGAVHLNFPSRRDESGRWRRLVEIRSTKLETFVRQAIERAVSEALA